MLQALACLQASRFHGNFLNCICVFPALTVPEQINGPQHRSTHTGQWGQPDQFECVDGRLRDFLAASHDPLLVFLNLLPLRPFRVRGSLGCLTQQVGLSSVHLGRHLLQ